MPRVPGHGLQREGRAHDSLGRYTGQTVGHALCACGEMSPELESTARRQRWSATHKAEALAEAERRELPLRPILSNYLEPKED